MEVKDLNPHGYPTTPLQDENLKRLCAAVSEIQRLSEISFVVTSGLRTPEDQNRINPAVKRSAHLSGEAVDISDADGRIYDFCINNIDSLIRLGIYLESRTYTPRWIHMQVRAPLSGNRIFIP